MAAGGVDAAWPAALAAVLRAEGGMVGTDDPDDRGGSTFAGISQRWHPDWRGWRIRERILNNTLYPDIERDLHEAVAEFYRDEFWVPLRCVEIPESAVRHALLLDAVHRGRRRAVKLAQRALGVTSDGEIGPETLGGFALACGTADSVERFCLRHALLCVASYIELVRRDPSQVKYLLGWYNRAAGGLT